MELKRLDKYLHAARAYLIVLGRMFHYSNIHSFATAFEYMKLHSKVRPCQHPATCNTCTTATACKEFQRIPHLATCTTATAGKEFQRSAVSQLIFAKQGLNFISRLGQSFVMKICNRQKVSKWTGRKRESENAHATNIQKFICFDGQMFECKKSAFAPALIPYFKSGIIMPWWAELLRHTW